jgi:hypothetical protein
MIDLIGWYDDGKFIHFPFILADSIALITNPSNSIVG